MSEVLIVGISHFIGAIGLYMFLFHSKKGRNFITWVIKKLEDK